MVFKVKVDANICFNLVKYVAPFIINSHIELLRCKTDVLFITSGASY